MTWEQFIKKYPEIGEGMMAFGMSKEQYLDGAMKMVQTKYFSSNSSEPSILPVHEEDLLDALDKFSENSKVISERN